MIESEDDLHRYRISIGDFEDAMRFASRAMVHSADTIEHESLLISAIIAYACPFSPNERKPHPITASIQIENFSLSVGELALHGRLIEWRNKAIAHSSYEVNPTKLVQGGRVVQSMRFSILNQQIDVSAVVVLSERLRDKCQSEYADCVARRNHSLGPEKDA